jgi:hypothetical protein
MTTIRAPAARRTGEGVLNYATAAEAIQSGDVHKAAWRQSPDTPLAGRVVRDLRFVDRLARRVPAVNLFVVIAQLRNVATFFTRPDLTVAAGWVEIPRDVDQFNAELARNTAAAPAADQPVNVTAAPPGNIAGGTDVSPSEITTALAPATSAIVASPWATAWLPLSTCRVATPRPPIVRSEPTSR